MQNVDTQTNSNRKVWHAFIDNLNVLYVAFTRAKEELIVFAPQPQEGEKQKGNSDKMSLVSDVIWSVLSSGFTQTGAGERLISLTDPFNSEEGIFELGSWWHPSVSHDSEGIQEIMMHQLRFVSPGDRLRLRLHGKGQVGNSWESEAGKNLMFSVLLHPDFVPANQQFLISQISALAVQQMLETFVKPISVKWPNDIYWNDKKICGMLIENDIAGTKLINSIIGIGININQKKFISNAPNPVSLTQITGKEYDLHGCIIKM